MTAKRVRTPKLCLVSAEKQNYIQVPSGRSAALVSYLRRSGLHVSPPGPCTADSETVALLGKVDADAIKRLLDGWK
jgi:hypothetical protein